MRTFLLLLYYYNMGAASKLVCIQQKLNGVFVGHTPTCWILHPSTTNTTTAATTTTITTTTTTTTTIITNSLQCDIS